MSDSLVNKLILLRKALEEIAELDKSMSNSGLGGPGSVKAGAVLPNKTFKVKKPGNNSIASKIKIPSVAPQSNKDPIKSIQQIHNKDIKDIKMKEAQAKFGEVMKTSANGQWSLEKSDNETKEAKPAFDGSYHGQVHERMTEKGHKVVMFPAKLPDGSTEMRGRKIPLKVKIKHTWDDHKKEWTHSGTEVMNPGSKVDSDAPARSYPPQNAKTMDDVAKEKMESFNKPKQDEKPKTVVRKLKKSLKTKPFSSKENKQILEPMAARLSARSQIKDKNPSADVDKLIPEPDLRKLRPKRKNR